MIYGPIFSKMTSVISISMQKLVTSFGQISQDFLVLYWSKFFENGGFWVDIKFKFRTVDCYCYNWDGVGGQQCWAEHDGEFQSELVFLSKSVNGTETELFTYYFQDYEMFLVNSSRESLDCTLVWIERLSVRT